MKVVLICGSTDWTDEEPIRLLLESLPLGSCILTSDDEGAAEIVIRIAKEIGIDVQLFPTNRDLLGRGAAKARDLNMLDRRPDEVYVFLANNQRRPREMISEARRRGIPVVVTRADAEHS